VHDPQADLGSGREWAVRHVIRDVADQRYRPEAIVHHPISGHEPVITNAATGGGDVRALVYIDAFAPDEGEMTSSILGGSGSALDVPDPTTVLDLAGYPGAPDGDVEAFLKPDTVHSSFAQDLSETDRWLIAAGQRPLTLSANTTPSLTAAWKTLPSWTVVGTQDRIIPPGVQRRMAQRAGATISEVAASHVSMISKPQATIDAILAAVAATSD
jgi:pimeloyl-ACP methyl ester carboxylesterase